MSAAAALAALVSLGVNRKGIGAARTDDGESSWADYSWYEPPAPVQDTWSEPSPPAPEPARDTWWNEPSSPAPAPEPVRDSWGSDSNFDANKVWQPDPSEDREQARANQLAREVEDRRAGESLLHAKADGDNYTSDKDFNANKLWQPDPNEDREQARANELTQQHAEANAKAGASLANTTRDNYKDPNSLDAKTVFQLLPTRSTASAQHILGEQFGGIVGSDRYSAYNWLEVDHRQICWAHLRRDFQSFIERGEESRRIGQALLEQVSVMFALWSQTQVGNISRAEFQNQMRPVQHRVGELVREGQSVEHVKTSRTCTHLLKIEPA